MITATKSQPSSAQNCAFACHEGDAQTTSFPSIDNYQIARNLGVSLRIDLVAQAVKAQEAGFDGALRGLRQAHARKNHSYFLVFLKPKGKQRWKGLEATQRLTVHDGPVRRAGSAPNGREFDLFR